MDTFDYSNFFELVIGLIAVISLMYGLLFLLKKFNLVEGQAGVKIDRRLNIAESLMLDNRRRAVILRCDDEEHLVILSQSGETVVKAGMPVLEKEDISAQE